MCLIQKKIQASPKVQPNLRLPGDYPTEYPQYPKRLHHRAVITTTTTTTIICYTYNEYGHPGQADVVERYGALERVLALRLALGVVIVPVDTRPVGKGHGGRGIAYQSVVSSRGRQVETRMHPVVFVFRTNVILFLVVQRIVRRQHPERNHE